MKIYKSLYDLGLIESNFPIFFQEKWLRIESKNNTEVKFYFSELYNSIILFKIEKLKIIRKGTYIWVPLNLSGEVLSKENELKVCIEFHDFIKKNKLVDVIFPPRHLVNFRVIPPNSLVFELDIIRLKIDETPELNLKKMSSNYRNEIKKAIDNVTIKFGSEYIEEFYTLYSDTHKRQNLNFESIVFFNDLIGGLGNHVLIGKSVNENNIEGAILVLYDKQFGYYFYAGSAAKCNHPGSNKLLMFELTNILSLNKVPYLIMGGYRKELSNNSKYNGIQNYKLRFGCDVITGYHFVKVINHYRYNLFLMMTKIKGLITRTDLSLINLNGVKILKN
jgi:hypothetical protein